MSGSRWVLTLSWLSGSWQSFLYSSFAYSCHLFLISSASVRSIPFLSFIVLIFVWKFPLVSLIFLKRSLVFFYSIVFFYFFSFVTEEVLSLLVLWNSSFKRVYLSFSPLLLASLLFIAKISLTYASIVRPPQTTIFPFCISFFGDDLDHCLLYNIMNVHP